MTIESDRYLKGHKIGKIRLETLQQVETVGCLIWECWRNLTQKPYVKSQIYLRLSIEANSFNDAISEFFKRNKECINGVLDIYCKRPKSGD